MAGSRLFSSLVLGAALGFAVASCATDTADPGETDYSVTLSATSTDQEVTCEGSAPFNVEVGQTTNVMVMLNCKKPRTLGGVRVNGKFKICTQLTKAVVAPLQTSLGNDISLGAQAFDEEGDPITYTWTGNGGSIADPTAASTTYTCWEVGNHTLTILVTDNGTPCNNDEGVCSDGMRRGWQLLERRIHGCSAPVGGRGRLRLHRMEPDLYGRRHGDGRT